MFIDARRIGTQSVLSMNDKRRAMLSTSEAYHAEHGDKTIRKGSGARKDHFCLIHISERYIQDIEHTYITLSRGGTTAQTRLQHPKKM
jgi:hypothetical protein